MIQENEAALKRTQGARRNAETAQEKPAVVVGDNLDAAQLMRF